MSRPPCSMRPGWVNLWWTKPANSLRCSCRRSRVSRWIYWRSGGLHSQRSGYWLQCWISKRTCCFTKVEGFWTTPLVLSSWNSRKPQDCPKYYLYKSNTIKSYLAASQLFKNVIFIIYSLNKQMNGLTTSKLANRNYTYKLQKSRQ
jgi:hypothetical protein